MINLDKNQEYEEYDECKEDSSVANKKNELKMSKSKVEQAQI